jgi:signal peptidase I
VELQLDFEKRYRLVREIVETVVLTVLMFLVIRLAVQNFNVDGMSMEPNLHNQELILVDKWSYLFRTPARGDVIVFIAPPNPQEDFVKRVIGLPGDVVTIQGTTVIVNGKVLTEKYVRPQNNLHNPFPSFTNRIVPPNTYLVLGDNRDGSSDSRDWGCVPQQNIIGRAALIYWPLGQDNDGLLPNVSSTYTKVPAISPVQGDNVCPVMHLPGAPAASTQPQPLDGLGNGNVALMLAMPALFVVFTSRFRKKNKK